MKKIKNQYKLLITMFLFWMLLTLDLTILNLSFGVIISVIVTRTSYDVLYDNNGFRFKELKLMTLFLYTINLFVEIFKSSFRLILCIIKKEYTPVIEEVQLEVSDPLIIAIISMSITLTPGTITVDSKNNLLRVLSFKDYGDNGETVRKDIKEKFEKFFI